LIKIKSSYFFLNLAVETVGQTYGPTSSQISSVFIKIYRSRPLDGAFRNVCINKCTSYFSFWSKCE